MAATKRLVLLCVVLLLAACREPLAQTPYALYGAAGERTFDLTPEPRRTPEIPVVYVTDRVREQDSRRGAEYGYRRSRDLVYGIATVSLDPRPTWEQLVVDSTRGRRSETYTPSVTRIEELGRFVALADRLEIRGGVPAATPEAVEAVLDEWREFYTVLDRYLDHTDIHEAVVFVHGYNNPLDGAAVRLAQGWHFSGRQGVPILFSWPAGSTGILRGYTYDRESGEFATLHLKQLLIALAACPRIERVHVVSHSRGADVASTAIRELNAELRGVARTNPLIQQLLPESQRGPFVPPGADRPPVVHDLLKLETLVLASPDLDLEVFTQRFLGENMIRAANRVVIYFSAQDRALALADFLFSSDVRVGAIRPELLSPRQRSRLAQLTSMELINCTVTGFDSHSYLAQHPGALSDLILLLRDRAPAGSATRPLRRGGDGIWVLDDDYLKPEAESEDRARDRPR